MVGVGTMRYLIEYSMVIHSHRTVDNPVRTLHRIFLPFLSLQLLTNGHVSHREGGELMQRKQKVRYSVTLCTVVSSLASSFPYQVGFYRFLRIMV